MVVENKLDSLPPSIPSERISEETIAKQIAEKQRNKLELVKIVKQSIKK